MWHEPGEGVFDLTGETDPRRDLAGFCALVERFGMGLIAKPGPFVDAELLGGGVPNWLHRAHPELIAERANGEPFLHSDSHDPRCSVRHPVYVEAVGRWFDAVVPVLLQLQARGALRAVQVDNECPGDGFWSYDMDLPSPNRLDYNDPLLPDGLVREWPSPPPATWEEMAPFIELERLADEQMTGAVATFAEMLRARGVTAPLFHDLCCGRWEIAPMIADVGLLAKATGWLGANVYAEELREPFVLHGEYGYSFEEYVHYGWWRPRLMRSLSPGKPVLIPEIASVDERYLQIPLIGGTDDLCIYMLHQVPEDPPDIGSYPAWAMEAPMREDGEPEQHLWAAKTLFLYQAAGGDLLAGSRVTADVALTYRREPELAASWAEIDGAGWPAGDGFGEEVHGRNDGRRLQERAHELVRRQVEFDVIDVRFPPVADWEARYRHVLEAGDEVPDDPSLRVAWTDAPDVDAGVRFAVDGSVFLTLVNRSQERRAGTVAWRGGGALAFATDGPSVCAAHVRDGGVLSAILGGGATLGDLAFTGRLGAVGTFGETLVLTAPVDGTFTVPVGDRDVARLSFRGEVAPWTRHDRATVRFDALVGDGHTDVLFVGPPPEAWLDSFDTYWTVVHDQVEPEQDWEELQWAFAQARSRGELEDAAQLERRLRLLARIEAVAPPEARR
jgi:hypothetical protein